MRVPKFALTDGRLFVLALIGVFGLLVVQQGSGRTAAHDLRGLSIHGVWLGLTALQVQRRFEDAPYGEFSELKGCSSPTLLWQRRDEGKTTIRSARFEFHDGMLVAMRMRLAATDPLSRGPRLETSTGSLLGRATTADRDTALVWLVRDCDSHAEEAAELLASGRVRY